jgi:hypothetical protein
MPAPVFPSSLSSELTFHSSANKLASESFAAYVFLCLGKRKVIFCLVSLVLLGLVRSGVVLSGLARSGLETLATMVYGVVVRSGLAWLGLVEPFLV